MKKKALERLRGFQQKALARMEKLGAVETGDKPREMTAAERKEYDELKGEVEELAAEITGLEKELTADGAAKQPPAAPQTAETGAQPAGGSDLGQQQVDHAKLAATAAKTERLRISGIQGIVKQAHNLCEAIPETLAEELIGDPGMTLEKARSEVFSRIEAEQAKTPTVTQQRAGITADAREKYRDKMEAGILLRADPEAGKNKELAELGHDFRGFSLLEMARDYLAYAGVKTRGMARDQVVRAAFGDQEFFAGGLHTTSDFPNILANVAKNTLRMGYEAAPRTFTLWCRQVSTPDFKPINRMQLSDIAALRKVNEAGEYKRTTLSDSKETYSLATYGDIVAITRRTIINDDLDALNRIPRAMGQSAAQMEGDVVYTILTAGQTMTEDSKALFHADHGNLNTGTAFDDDGLSAARLGMRVQTAPKGTRLNLMLKYIILPAALERDAEQVTNPMNLAPATFANVIPNWMRSLTPVIEPRLDADSSTTWYCAADPGTIDTIEYCYLEGEQGVTIETRQGFDVDGIEIKAREDFAAAAIDYRGLAKNTN